MGNLSSPVARVLLLLGLAQGAQESQKQTVCGKRLVSGRILNGQDAPDGAWPWQVSVRRHGFHICGGALVSESWVVSAAHCFAPSVATSAYRVHLGENQSVPETPTQASLSVKRIVPHPDYNGVSFFADIALLELENPLAFTAAVHPICLLDAAVRVPAGQPCWVTGWGNIRPQETPSTPERLQQLGKPAGDNPVKEDMLCAGSMAGDKGTAPGDSGGPLVCEEGGTWYLAGIVSWLLKTTVNGIASVAPGYPGVYNRPNAHAEWIQGNVPGVTFLEVNFTPNTASPATTVLPRGTTVLWSGACPAASLPGVLLLAGLLPLAL
nr:LOW QUALITY PROTEIN: serine protease 27-like [Pelodiscus sinensis]|eukprot:XP_025046103.1 LOW QUALITY PROTEIN: serine protease 27-like [Pelodiscus sinensis]